MLCKFSERLYPFELHSPRLEYGHILILTHFQLSFHFRLLMASLLWTRTGQSSTSTCYLFRKKERKKVNLPKKIEFYGSPEMLWFQLPSQKDLPLLIFEHFPKLRDPLSHILKCGWKKDNHNKDIFQVFPYGKSSNGNISIAIPVPQHPKEILPSYSTSFSCARSGTPLF